MPRPASRRPATWTATRTPRTGAANSPRSARRGVSSWRTRPRPRRGRTPTVFDALTPGQVRQFAEIGEAINAALHRAEGAGRQPRHLALRQSRLRRPAPRHAPHHAARRHPRRTRLRVLGPPRSCPDGGVRATRRRGGAPTSPWRRDRAFDILVEQPPPLREILGCRPDPDDVAGRVAVALLHARPRIAGDQALVLGGGEGERGAAEPHRAPSLSRGARSRSAIERWAGASGSTA
jgi:hypothetical protein